MSGSTPGPAHGGLGCMYRACCASSARLVVHVAVRGVLRAFLALQASGWAFSLSRRWRPRAPLTYIAGPISIIYSYNLSIKI